MIRATTALTSAAVTIASVIASTPAAKADSTVAYCMVSVHDHSIPVSPLRACHFAQYQGNAYVRLADGTNYEFPEKEQGSKHYRQSTSDALAFTIPGDRTIHVVWAFDGITCSREK